VRSLIDNNINIAAVKRTAPPVVEGWETALARKEHIEKDKKEKDDDRTGSAPLRVASMTRASSDAPIPGSTDPIKPNAVKTVAVHPGSMRTAALTPLPSESRQLTPLPPESAQATITTVITAKTEPAAVPPPAPAAPAPEPLVTKSDPPPPAAPAKMASAVPSVPVSAQAPEPSVRPRSGWIIQIGALPDEKEAWQRLELAQTKVKDLLRRADPFTERIEKGEKILFRARFAGLEKNQAEAACKHLKRSDIPCMLVKN
jgi:D-alanyl-D-alanine carboxypeptidase